MKPTERARLQDTHAQTADRWFADDRLPVPAARVNARTVLTAPDAARRCPASRAAAA